MRISSFASLTAGLVLVLFLLGPVAAASAQGYIDQVAVVRTNQSSSPAQLKSSPPAWMLNASQHREEKKTGY